METPNTDTAVYTDFNKVAALRLGAKKDPKAALKKVAEQFEAIFTKMMLKQMRQAKLSDGMFESKAKEMYMDLYDNQMSLELSKQRGLGLADIIVKQLDPMYSVEDKPKNISIEPTTEATLKIHAKIQSSVMAENTHSTSVQYKNLKD